MTTHFLSYNPENRLCRAGVIASEGQAVDIRGGRVYVDGRELWGPYTRGGRTLLPGPDGGGGAATTFPHVIPEGCVWVMGDNREQSRDSRFFGDVPVASVTTRVLCTYWPPERVGPVR